MWRLYIIYHRYIKPEFHQIDPSFDKAKVHLFQTSGYTPECPKDYTSLGYVTHKESDFKIYDPSLQKKKYFAPSVLYHVHKNSWYPTEYLGFLEYDFKFEISQKDVNKLGLDVPQMNPCEFIEKNLKKGRIIVLSARWRLQELNSQKNITVGGKHWLDHFLQEYNNFYSTKWTKTKLLETNPIVPTQQSFICDVETYQIISNFIVYLVDNLLMEKSYPVPATLLERYIGMCICLSGLEIVYLPLAHQAHHGYTF